MPPFQSTSSQTLGESERYNNPCTLQSKGKARLDDSPLRSSCLKGRGNLDESKHAEDSLGTSSSQSFSCVSNQLQYLDTHKLYSCLPSLDREILDSICKATDAENQELWKGAHLQNIIAAVSSNRTNPFTEEEFTFVV